MGETINNNLKICYRCGEAKKKSKFEHHYGFKDGRSTICRDCRNSDKRNRRLKVLMEGIYSPPETRNCCLCDTEKQIGEFRRNSRERSGYGWECKKCCAQAR